MLKPKIKVPHTLRYFIPLGLLIFYAYWKGLFDKWTLLLMGPILYLASIIKGFAGETRLTTGSQESYFGLLLPMTLLYFGMISFLFKKLFAEQGLIKSISLVGMAGFLGYIHYMAWINLQGYFLPPY